MASPQSYLTETELNIFRKYGMEEDVPSIGRLIGKRLKHRQEKWTTHKEEQTKAQGETQPATKVHMEQGLKGTEGPGEVTSTIREDEPMDQENCTTEVEQHRENKLITPEAEKVNQPPTEHVSQAPAKHENMTPAENVSQPSAEHVSQLQVENVSQLQVEDVSQQQAENVNQLKVEHVSEPQAKDLSQPNVKYVNQPTAENVGQPQAEDVSHFQAEHVSQPPTEHVNQPIVENVNQLKAENVNQGSGEPEEKSKAEEIIFEEPKETISTGTEAHLATAPTLVEERPVQPPIRIILLGPEGVGKSALGNLLLGHDAFNVAEPSGCGDRECRQETGNGVQVIDTPGRPFTEVSNQKGNGLRKFFTSATQPENHNIKQIENEVKQADVIVFVLNTSHKRTPDMGINAFRKVLPPGACRASFLVTTHADTHYKAKGTTELLDDLTESPDMKDFLHSIEHRAVLVELGDGQRSEEAIVNGIAVYEAERIQARQMVMSMVKHVFC